MITPQLVKKINALWQKQKTVGLTDEEKKEQRLARQEYLQGIRGQVRGMLKSINKPGSSQKQKHAGKCSCGHCKH